MLSLLSCFRKEIEPDTWVKGSTAVVTGGNSGIGLETVKQLRQYGVNVIIGCRDVEKGKKCVELISKEQGDKPEYGKITVMEIDVSDFTSISNFVTNFSKVHHKLEILVNNAGTSMSGKHLDKKSNYSVCFQTNYLGPVHLTNLLTPYLLAAKQARIVNLSSVTHRGADAQFDKAISGEHKNTYGESKLAITLFGKELQRRFAIDNINHVKVVNVNPGGVNSNIWRRWPVYYRCIFKFILLTPEQGCMSSVYGAVGKDVKGGEYITVNYVPTNNNFIISCLDTLSFYSGHCVTNYSPICTSKLEAELWDKTKKWINNAISPNK